MLVWTFAAVVVDEENPHVGCRRLVYPRDPDNHSLSRWIMNGADPQMPVSRVRLAGLVSVTSSATIALLSCGSFLGPSRDQTPCLVTERPAGIDSAPIFVRPFEGAHQVTNYFDHEFPAPAERGNGYQATFCGSQFAGFVDGHTGYDWLMATGTPIFAVADGKVEFAGLEPPFSCGSLGVVSGLVVQIRHTADTVAHVMVYAHLSELAVAAGDAVTAGQRIAASGSTGCSTEPHLHFEVWRSHGGTLVATDPYGWWPSRPDPWANHPSGAPSVWLWKAGEAPALLSARASR
jgi:murein DD-endopeptidase MepM/ murein hydrolase activator NlpD